MAQFPLKNGLIQGTLDGTATGGTVDISGVVLENGIDAYAEDGSNPLLVAESFSSHTGDLMRLDRAGSPVVTIDNSGVATLVFSPSLPSVTLRGSTSGTCIISAPAVAGTTGITFPAASGTLATLAGTETFTNKTLTTPKFADLGFIADANGNELLIFDTVTSAVNEVTFANAATGTSPTFSATGGDTNIGINLTTKGTGTVNTATGFLTSGGASSSAVGFGWATNTGLYKTAGNTFTFAVSGTDNLTINSAGSSFSSSLRVGTGTTTSPSYGFNAETGYGINRSSGTMDFIGGTAVRAQITSTGFTLADTTFLNVGKTITAGGTTGAQTINKISGSVNFAAAATSLVVTNSFVSTSSVIIATVGTNDSTLKSVACVAASGSFTMHANAAATAETKVFFLVIN